MQRLSFHSDGLGYIYIGDLIRNLNDKDLTGLPGKRLKKTDTFNFRCHSGLDCFNQCCRNLNLMLYPYDIIRLKQSLFLSSDQFLDRYVDVVLRAGNYFPDVLLKMSDNPEKTCPFLTPDGCSVYPDRPDTCRTFPVEQGVVFDDNHNVREVFQLFRPPEFCLGKYEDTPWTIQTWDKDQESEKHHKMTLEWSKIKHRFQIDPWHGQGPDCPNGKMAFMATYNMDAFREFVLKSSFLKRYRVKPDVVRKLKGNDVTLMKLGFDWVMLFVWGVPSKNIRLR